jgi:hypothetical protein
MSEPQDERRAYAEALLRDLARCGWRITLSPDGKARFTRARKNAKPLRFELKFWLREHHREVRRILFRERKLRPTEAKMRPAGRGEKTQASQGSKIREA